MNIEQALPLLGGLTPKAFMRRYWQKTPLVIRQVISGFSSQGLTGVPARRETRNT